MSGVWAVARYTLSQCLRMKLAAVFLAALAVTLLVLPLALEGDGTLAGRIRSVLTYSTATVSVLLSFMTVLLTVGIVAGDMQARTVFLLAVKPLPRWKYIVGRWAGVVLLDAALLAISGGAIYAVAQHLREEEALNHTDRVAVETEVFVARSAMRPRLRKDASEPIAPGTSRRWTVSGVRASPVSVEGRARLQARLTEHHAFVRGVSANLRPLLENARRRDAIAEAWITGDERGRGIRARVEAEGRRLVVVYRAGNEQLAEALRPGQSVTVVLVEHRHGGPQTRGEGAVVARESHLRAAFEALDDVADHIAVGEYVGIRGVDGRVEHFRDNRFTVRFLPRDAHRPQVADLTAGEDVPVTVRPSLQLRYELSGRGTSGGVFGQWTAGSARSPYPPLRIRRRFPAGTIDTLAIPERLVGPGGDLFVEFTNGSGVNVTVDEDTLSVLYRAGGFTGNFLRGFGLMLAQMMFLAALGVFAGSFLSFPVGCLFCAAMLPFAMMRSFIADAVKLPRHGETDPVVWIGHGAFRLMQILVPDFARTSPSDALAAGRIIPWREVIELVGLTGGLQCVLAITFACLIFRKRELARVQV